MPKISEAFEVAQPVERVWDFLKDLPAVASCLPGAAITEQSGEEAVRGTMTTKLGAVRATFDGEATVVRMDDEAREAEYSGKGKDKKGGSRANATFVYRVNETSNGSRVEIDADIKLSGPLAQFGRTGILNDVAHQLTRDFAAALEQKLAQENSTELAAGATPEGDEVHHEPKPSELGLGKLLLAILRGRWRALRNLFAR